MNVALGALIAVAVGVLLVGCTSECKQAAEVACGGILGQEAIDLCVADLVLENCGGNS